MVIFSCCKIIRVGPAGDDLEQRVYSRKYLRIKPDTNLFGAVRIIEANGSPVISNSAKVRILDFSVGGVRFASKLKFPVGKRAVLELLLRLDDMDYRLEGFIVHSSRTQTHGYEYGFCFRKPELGLRRKLIAIFGKLLVRQGRYILLMKPNNGGSNK